MKGLSPEEIEEFKKAQARGRWGFKDRVASVTGQALLTVETPAWMARPWTINLLAHRWAGDGGTLTANVPPDNQTASAFISGGSNVPTEIGYYVDLDYGIDGASDMVRVDYPWSGCSFNVLCSTIRLAMVAPQFASLVLPANRPIIGANCSPWPAEAQSSQINTAPSYTVWLNLGATATAVVWVPARARGYRLFVRTLYTAGGATQPTVTVSQRTFNGATITAADTVIGDTAPFFPAVSTTNRSNVIPLQQMTQGLTITNDNATTTLAAGIQFLLDLG